MRFELNRYQRVALVAVAAAIMTIQLAQFDDEGFEGYGWVFSLLSAGLLSVLALTRNSRPKAVAQTEPRRSSLRNKEELAIAHAAFRENA